MNNSKPYAALSAVLGIFLIVAIFLLSVQAGGIRDWRTTVETKDAEIAGRVLAQHTVEAELDSAYATLHAIEATPTSYPALPITREECEAYEFAEDTFLIEEDIDIIVLAWDHLQSVMILEACIDLFGEPFNNWQKDYLGNAFDELTLGLDWLDPVWRERIIEQLDNGNGEVTG
jgi:hypothetical protein